MEAAFGHDVVETLARAYALEVLKRVGIGVYNDGFIHAGNLAYLALLAMFLSSAAAIAHLLGRTEDGALTVTTFLAKLPPVSPRRCAGRST
jgi:membrane protein